MTAEWLEERVREIREKLTPADEGSLWTLFFAHPAGPPVMGQAIDGAMDEMDLDLLRKYAGIVSRVGAKAILIAVVRADGRPRPEDRQLWRDLQVLLRGSPCQVLGFAVVGAASYWFAPGDGADVAA